MAYSANKDARVIPVNDYGVEVASGSLLGHSGVNKFGRNTSCAAGASEQVWDGSTAYSFPATALITSMSQTVNQAAMVSGDIEIQGLDANWLAVTQTVALNGTNTTTAVTLTTPLIRVFRMKVLENVVVDSPVRVHNVGETVDYAIIGIGFNQTQMAIYTTPAATKAYITSYYAVHNPTQGQTFTSNDIGLWLQDNANGYAPQLTHISGVVVDGHFNHPFYPYIVVGEKTDIFITSNPTGTVADVSAGFDLVLVQDQY